MRLNLPWWLNPWAEVRRLRDHLQRRSDEAEKAARCLFEVQSYSAAQLRTARMEVAHARAREEAYRQKLVEIANLMPPPIQFVRKED
ncbi:hypothetical protein C7W88_16920 [Novosphingobium sp. THN1]|uniref:hypothetical protein n=1 Tax=Novosphingobium sp. THN1 TaxID=1016987 RepID=UPI000E5132C6|nr:hypothetical protein [Novosphingobium sp. THN1]AXU20362.1 hypothetical protein C7W88_16920 [Novosphingobium sp. THN1]